MHHIMAQSAALVLRFRTVPGYGKEQPRAAMDLGTVVPGRLLVH